MNVGGSTGLWLPPFITSVVGDSELQEEPQQLFQGGDTDGCVEPVLHWKLANIPQAAWLGDAFLIFSPCHQ